MFVPGNSEKMLTKAMGLANLDVAMFDLEDGVPTWQKDEARVLTAQMAGRPPGGPIRYIRVNAISTPWFEADAEAVVQPGVEGIVLPKTETVRDVLWADAFLAAQERKQGMEVGTVRILAAI